MNMKPLVQNLAKNFKTVMESLQPGGTCLSLCTGRTFTKQALIAITLKITSVPRLPDLWPDLMGEKKKIKGINLWNVTYDSLLDARKKNL